MKAKVTANGQEIQTELPCAVYKFLEDQGLNPKSVVVELNGSPTPPSEFQSKNLQAGDKLEIVKVVAGG